MSNHFHDGNRELQDRFDTRQLADYCAGKLVKDFINPKQKAFIESADMFFLATVDQQGHPCCSYKGGDPGFVRVIDNKTVAFPCYDGNGMFRSLGNIMVNPHVGMLFIDFQEGDRMRVNGRAEVRTDDPLLHDFPGARSIVRVHAEIIFPNCPRYIHRLEFKEYSVYAPREDHTPPVPGWKNKPVFKDALPKR